MIRSFVMSRKKAFQYGGAACLALAAGMAVGGWLALEISANRESRPDKSRHNDPWDGTCDPTRPGVITKLIQGGCVEGGVVHVEPCLVSDGSEAYCIQMTLDIPRYVGRRITLVTRDFPDLQFPRYIRTHLGDPTKGPNRVVMLGGRWVEPWPDPYTWDGAFTVLREGR